MESMYLIDENNNMTANTMIATPNNINNNSKPIGVTQQVVMVGSISSGSSSSLSSNSSCSSTTSSSSSGNSSAGSTTSLASHYHQDHLVSSHSVPVTSSGMVPKLGHEVQLLQQVGDSNLIINNFPTTTLTAPPSTTATTNTITTPNQVPKPRGRRKKIRTEPIRPICPQCEKQFSNQSALTKHKLTHSDERKFACQQCSKAFKRHDHLTGHMQTHSNRKPFNCTIQGCDKTYCDARSLRRHKENIHHIVAPRDCNSNNNGSIGGGSSNNNNHGSLVQQSIKTEQTSCAKTGTAIGQQPSQLLRRRIQRLHSDPGGQFDEPTGRLIEMDRHSVDQQHYSRNSQLNSHHYPLQLQQHQQQQQHQQASSFSADYASTQHFFQFNQMAPMEQQYCTGGSMPHSADSIDDVNLGSNVHYEQQQPMTPNQPQDNQQQQQQHNHSNTGYLTPTTSHPPPSTPTFNAPNDQQQNYQQLNGAVQHQPSQLLRKRIQRLRSDPGGPHGPGHSPDSNCRSTEINRRSVDSMNNHYHHQQAPYSADYASTQHFSFDFNHQMAPTSMDQQYCNGQFSGSTGTIPPHSADSVADSSIELSIQYEQQVMTPNNHHHHSGYITPITPNTQHPSTPNMLAPPQSAPGQPYAISHQGQYQQQPHTVTLVPPPSFTSSDTNQQPSHLLRRRIQRFQSDPGDKIENVACRPIETQRRSVELTNSHYQYNNNLQQQQQQHHHHNQHASFSADYASTQHFSFEFASHTTTPMDQQFCQGSTIPHSADSINDSSLSLSVHYEQLTPNSGNQQQQQHASYVAPNNLHPLSPSVVMQTQTQQHQQHLPFSNSNDQHQQMIITSPH